MRGARLRPRAEEAAPLAQAEPSGVEPAARRRLRPGPALTLALTLALALALALAQGLSPHPPNPDPDPDPDPDQAKSGMVTHGVVWRVSAKGVIVTLLGEVRGLVPSSELRPYLAHISPISRPYLAHIPPISRLSRCAAWCPPRSYAPPSARCGRRTRTRATARGRRPLPLALPLTSTPAPNPTPTPTPNPTPIPTSNPTPTPTPNPNHPYSYQVVRCRVVRSEPARRQLLLSFAEEGGAAAVAAEAAGAREPGAALDLAAGALLEGATVEAVAPGGLWAALPGGGFGWLATAHLGDYAPLEEAWEM